MTLLISDAHSCSDYYNNGGANGGSTGMVPGAGPAASASAGGPPGTGGFPTYYQNDGGYSSPGATGKNPGKKAPMHQGTKPPGTGAAPGTYQNPTGSGQSSYGQYGQGYGQGKKNLGQTQGGASGGGYGNYSTAYPSQVTGGPGSQDYGYEGRFFFFCLFMSNS